MLVGGYEVDSADTAELAMARLAAVFEYNEHGSELELARLRLRQARERLTERFPTAARDAQLASVLEGLGDALGAGPEAAEPVVPSPAAGRFGRLLTPDLAIVVDGSGGIVLVVTEPQGKLLRKVTVTDVDAFKAALDDARVAQQVALEEADEARLRGPDEKRRAEGKLTRSEAVEWLLAQGGFTRVQAVAVTAELRDDSSKRTAGTGMTYDGTYWVVPVITEQTAQ
jgi:hypothetical protein